MMPERAEFGSSNLIIRSNIYPRSGPLYQDREFIRRLRGRSALQKLLHLANMREWDLTEVQRKDYREDAKCTRNEDGDITWGIVRKDGQERWVCRCENYHCTNFRVCRKDVTEEEIRALVRRRLPVITTEATQACSDYIALPEQKPASTETTPESPRGGQKEGTFRYDELERVDVSELVHIETVLPDDARVAAQERVIYASPESRILVIAGPGTGKTHALIERLRYLTGQEAAVNPDDMIVLSFSRAAIAEIIARSTRLVHNTYLPDIRTFDSFATELLIEMNPGIDLGGTDYDDRIEMAIKTIKENPEMFKSAKHVLVDEIQDLVGVRARFVCTILEHISCGFTLLGDPCQSIYDYQVEGNDMTSDDFCAWVEQRYADTLERYTFTRNHRQKNNLRDITDHVRNCILEEDPAKLSRTFEDTLKYFPSLGKCYTLSDEFRALTRKSVCFLCRTNGQALKVSKYLRDQSVDHHLQKPATHKLLQRWIGEVLGEYNGRHIYYDDFRQKHERLFSADDSIIRARWDLLKRIEGGRSRGIDVSRLAEKLSQTHNIPKSLISTNTSDVVVSTIHRAKGREYDSVVLLEDQPFSEDSDSILDEARVFYVAVTRARESIFSTTLGRRLYMRKVPKFDERWMETGLKWSGGRSKQFLKFIEVGRENDVDPDSFVDVATWTTETEATENQEYIRTSVRVGDPVVLRIMDHEDSVIYAIYHNKRKIGRMSQHFTDAVFYALNDVYGTVTRDTKYFPKEIHEVFVDAVCSYARTGESVILHEPYRTNGMWTGISLVGLGKIVWRPRY